MIEIKEVKSKRDLKEFIKFPMSLYKGNEFYVPPLISEEISSLDTTENPVFGHAIAKYYLAFKNNKIVGRIAAIINWKEVQNQAKPKVRFGWFDFIDDKEVVIELLNKVEELGLQNNLNYMEGPVGFSNLDKAGLLTKGFNEIPTMVTLYNYPYYEKHLLDLGFSVSSEWVEYKLDFPHVIPDRVIKFSNLIKERYNLKVKKFHNKQELIDIVDPMFELIDKTYGHLSSYVPIPKQQIEHYKNKYIKLINTDYVTCVMDKNEKLIAFAITMPSYSKALQKAKGKLFPFGWWHLLRAGKNNDTAAFYLIGVDPEFQSKGVTSIIFEEMSKTFIKNGITILETNPELKENLSVQSLWKAYKPVNHKIRKTYRKDI